MTDDECGHEVLHRGESIHYCVSCGERWSLTARESTPWTRTLAELLRLALRQNVGLRNDLNDLVTLLRAHDDKHSPYALACRDIAVLLHDVLEKHR